MSFCRSSTLIIRRLLTKSCCHTCVTGTRNIKRWVAPTLMELQRRREKLGPEPEKPRSTFLEWNYEAEIYAFGKRLGEEFDTKLLKEALIQKEYANLREFKAKEQGVELDENPHNQALVNEGDKIIAQYVISEYSKSYPDDVVHSVYKYLTSDDMLSHIAKHIGLTDLVKTNEFPVEKSTLSNTFKAVIAVLKHSNDINRTELFLKDFLLSQMVDKDVYEIWDPEKPYEYLTDLAKQSGLKDLEARLCNQSAVNTILANYQVGIYSDKKLLGIGWGESVNIAKDTAAINAIQRIHSNNNYKQK